jgi:CubicO group peptidase (beta-lactamase class C family)
MRRTPIVLAVVLALTVGGIARGSQVATPAARPGEVGTAPLPLTGERRAAFEAYVADALAKFVVPGAAVAVVEGGDVVYLNGFGVKAFGGTQPVTPDTLMMIGSVTKSMTTMLAATLVDDGRLSWDTRLVDLLPRFAVGDPALTERLTVRDAFCNCAGLPGRDIPLLFAGDTVAPEEVVTALADVAPTAPFGERFEYNNLLIAAGGYALGPAAGGGAKDVGLAYDLALRERVLGPIGMARSTFDPAAVLADGDYALPHDVDPAGHLRRVPLIAERWILPVRPAGALWSSAREMARYVQTELAGGDAPGGVRVVSAEGLEETWAPGVAVPNLYGGPPEMAATMSRYGLGWLSGEYRGLRVVSHAGGSSGFAAEVAFLPEADLGIVILTNANALSTAHLPLAFGYAVQFRLFELLFDQPAGFDAELTAAGAAVTAAWPQAASGGLEPAAVAPYLGRYAHPELGEVTVSLRGDRLVLDTGELSTELRPRAADGGGATAYLLYDQPFALYSMGYGATVSFAGGASAPRLTLTIPANPTGPQQVYIFEPVAAVAPPG